MRPLIRTGLFCAFMAAGMGVHSHAKAEEVYMIRGFMNVFSEGMNQMTRQLKLRGCRAT